MKGDKVIVRTFGDKPVVCKVWEVTPQVIEVCSPENYERLSKGMDGLMPVGILKEDVFRYVPNYEKLSWERLTAYAR
jgi:hypothetical protein